MKMVTGHYWGADRLDLSLIKIETMQRWQDEWESDARQYHKVQSQVRG